MKKSILLSFMVAFLAGINMPALAYEGEKIAEGCFLVNTVIEDQEKLVVMHGNNPKYEVTTRSTADSVRLFYILKGFKEDVLKMMGVKWFKATLLSSLSEEHDRFKIDTYYDSSSAFQFAYNLYYFRSRNKELVKSVTSVDLIGMPLFNLQEIFGEGVKTPAGKGYRIMHSLKDISDYSSDDKLFFYLENDVVTEVAYEKHNNYVTSAMKSFWGYRPAPEGWLTKGECLGNNVNVRSYVPDGEIIGRIGENRENEVMILETATTGERYNWVKIITKSGLTGWVYGKYIRPALFGTSYEQTLNNSIEYCDWLSKTLGEPKSVEELKDNRGKIIGMTKLYDDYKVNTLTGSYAKDGEEFFSIEYLEPGYSFKNRFCGIGIGDDLVAAQNFAESMLLADAVPFVEGQQFGLNSSLKWVTVDQKNEIAVETTDGIISRIIVKKRIYNN